MVSGEEYNLVGSKFPCNVTELFVKVLATSGLIVQSTPKAETLDLVMSSKANQHPFPKAITCVKGLNASTI